MSRKLLNTLEERGYTAYKLKAEKSNAVSELLDVERRLSGIAELLIASDFSSFPPNSTSMVGVGEILEDLADSVSQVRNHLDEVAVGMTSDPSNAD